MLFSMGCLSTPGDWLEGKPKHHTTKGFRNYPEISEGVHRSLGFYFRRTMDAFFLPDIPSSHYLPEEEAVDRLYELMSHNTITWLGQSSFLIRINGLVILTDPYLTAIAGPSKGSRRFIPPGLSIPRLPPIDAIVVSHDHYDHLDAKTVKMLPNKEDITVFAPLGVAGFFRKRGYTRIHELDWNESVRFHNLSFTALPAVHHSGRWPGRDYKTLWCSWAIVCPEGAYYFAGDTGYSHHHFKRIHDNLGSFDLAMIPIGAYQPKQFQKYHVTPEQAVDIGLDLDVSVFVAMHWGTVKLSDEPIWEPPQRFKDKALSVGIPADRIWIMRIGETRILPSIGRHQYE